METAAEWCTSPHTHAHTRTHTHTHTHTHTYTSPPPPPPPQRQPLPNIVVNALDPLPPADTARSDCDPHQAIACSPLLNDASSIGASTIILVERGTCSFADKAWNVQQFGAAAVVIYNSDGGAAVQGVCRSSCARVTHPHAFLWRRLSCCAAADADANRCCYADANRPTAGGGTCCCCFDLTTASMPLLMQA